MAKSKVKEPDLDAGGLAAILLGELAKSTTAGKTITAGDLSQSTWGPDIPHMAFQYMIGGSTKLPCQRFISISGPPKSMKSTLLMEIGSWFMEQGGLYDDIDNETKTSGTMFDAMTSWRAEALSRGRHHLTHTESIEEWQRHISMIVKALKALPIAPPGKRIPVLIGLDSLTGKGLEMSHEKLVEEGAAAPRSYDGAAAANSVNQFIQNLSLRGTTVVMGMIRHLTETMGDQQGGPQKKESGAKRVGYQNSINLRVQKVETISAASHPRAFVDGPMVEGYTIRISPEASCIGPTIERFIDVDVIWQYVPQPDGQPPRQCMAYDWDGALGRLLWRQKYDAKFKAFEFEQNQLSEIVHFTCPKAKTIKCDALGLEAASFREFGQALKANPEIYRKLQGYFGIKDYPSVQDAEIEPDPGIGEK